MSISPSNIVRHELIGLDVTVERSTSKSLEGLKGMVVDESYGTLSVEVAEEERKGRGKKAVKEEKRTVKVIPKGNSIFIFAIPNGVKVQVDGQLLVGRPEDRIKKKFGRW
jgi:ribonuclease P protein subunit POP4